METSTVNGAASRSSRSSITPQTSEVPERPKRRRFSIAEKRRIVAAADACVPGTLGALLRREGIYSSLLARWRRQRNGGNFDAVVLRQRSSEKIEGQALQRRNAELEVENRKLLNRRLQRAELILEIQKKAAGLLGIELKGPDANESD
jgi:transposase